MIRLPHAPLYNVLHVTQQGGRGEGTYNHAGAGLTLKLPPEERGKGKRVTTSELAAIHTLRTPINCSLRTYRYTTSVTHTGPYLPNNVLQSMLNYPAGSVPTTTTKYHIVRDRSLITRPEERRTEMPRPLPERSLRTRSVRGRGSVLGGGGGHVERLLVRHCDLRYVHLVR